MFIEFTPTDKQAEALKYWMDDTTTEIWFWWAAWWAKTWLWVFAVFSACLELAKSRWVVWRKELINLRRTTLATYWKMVDFYNIPEKWKWELNGQTNTIIEGENEFSLESIENNVLKYDNGKTLNL